MTHTCLPQGGLLKTQIGTPYYMSPEIWANKPYNESSDMWALGCLTYELAALAPPFMGDSFPQLKRAVMQGRYKNVPKCYSYEMSTVINKLLRVSAGTRPSAAALLASPEVQKYMKPGGYGPIAPESQRPIDLMATIVVPSGPKRRISSVLPPPCYPDARPNSPSSWPVSARDRKEAIANKANGVVGGGLSNIDETKPESNPAPKRAVPASPGLPIKAKGGAAKVVSSARVEAGRVQQREVREPTQRKALAPLNQNERESHRPTGQKPPRQPGQAAKAGARPTAAAYKPANREGLVKPSRPGREGGSKPTGRPTGRPVAGGARYGQHGAAAVGGAAREGGYGQGAGQPNYRRGQYSYKPSWWG